MDNSIKKVKIGDVDFKSKFFDIVSGSTSLKPYLNNKSEVFHIVPFRNVESVDGNDIVKVEKDKIQSAIDFLKEKIPWLNIDKNGKIVYDFEDAINVSKNAEAIDMESFEQSLIDNTDFKSLDEFNEYLFKMVDLAGYNTSDGVVTAAMYLAYIYPKLTGRTIEYTEPGESTDGYRRGLTSDIKFDCRAFVWWCLYNGGFVWATNDDGKILNHSHSFIDWVYEKGMVRDGYDSAKPGDVVLSREHVLLVVGTYDGGYYTAEAQTNGLVVMQRSFENLEANGYTIVDMDQYYSKYKLRN